MYRSIMQNQNHIGEEKFPMSFGSFDTELFNTAHMGGLGSAMGIGMKRTAHEAGLDREPVGLSSDDDADILKREDKLSASSSRGEHMMLHHQQTNLDNQTHHPTKTSMLPNGKKTKGRVKIKMEFIDNKLRRYTTFSKRKTGIMKKAYELSTLTGTQVMLLVASETGHVYTFATRKLQPMITSDAGKALIQTCLNSPDPPPTSNHHHHLHHDQRMSATGYEETELTYAVNEDEHKVRQMMYTSPLSTMHHQGPTSMVSPPQAAAVAVAALQTHHHHPQYQHPHAPPTPHLTPVSTHQMSHHLSSQNTPPNNSIDHNVTSIGTLHQTHIPNSQTPIPAHSPLPSQSPMGTPSPTSPYPVLHHHPTHHHIPSHTR